MLSLGGHCSKNWILPMPFAPTTNKGQKIEAVLSDKCLNVHIKNANMLSVEHRFHKIR